MAKSLETQRTYALIGTGGTGKTSLAEMLLFQSKAISRLGKIEEGSTTLDYEPEETKRGGSVQPAFANFDWKGGSHYLIDVPGDNNFVGDLAYLLTAADAVVFTVDAVDGVRPLAKKFWDQVRDAGLPALIFVNKMDRDRADFNNVMDGLTSILGIKPVMLGLPIGGQSDFTGIVDVLDNTAWMFGEDGAVSKGDIPADLAEEVQTLRETTIENIAESDEELMEVYFEEGELSAENIRKGLHKGVLNGEVVPIIAGSSLENKGGQRVLDAIADLFPSPLERAPWTGADGTERASSPDEKVAAFAFKTLADPFAGQVTLFRVLSGELKADNAYANPRKGESERVGQFIHITGKTHNPSKEAAGPGAIIGVSKLKATTTGDTLVAEKDGFHLEPPQVTPTLITYALAPKEKGDEDKVYQAIQKLLVEDITLALSRDEETGDVLLSGMGQLHIETAVERAKRRYKVDIVLKTPKVPYRETIRGKADVQGRHKKQSGGRGQFGDCFIRMEPTSRGEGYMFEDAIVGGSIPRQYIPAVDKGIQEAAQRGYLAGCPVVDFKVTLYDGSYHSVDSSEMAFKVAGSLAFKKAMETAQPVLLEPIMLVTVSVPDGYMGDVIGDLSSRRGKVLGSDSAAGITEIKAHVPMSEILRYAPDLRSMTGGQGTFAMEFDHYEEAPPHVADKVIQESQAAEE
ncbi:MAG: elongation factor G [Oceanidesulfovibrio sp.]